MDKFDRYKLFVGCLPHDISEPELQMVFKTYGDVRTMRIMNPKLKDGYACAYVSYSTKEAGDDAISVLDGKYKIREGTGIVPVQVSWTSRREVHDGCIKFEHSSDPDTGMDRYKGNNWNLCAPSGWRKSNLSEWGTDGGQRLAECSKISWSKDITQGDWVKGQGTSKEIEPSNRLFVGNLPTDIDQSALHYVFGNYGNVEKIHIMTGRSKSGQACAFVEYSSADEVDTAILTLNERYEIRAGEGPILVKYADVRPRPNLS